MPDLIELIHAELLQNKSKRDGIVAGVLTAIGNGTVSKGDPLPSVNKLIQKTGVARMTVVKALNLLKERGIIVAEDKVGYYVRDVNVQRELKVFLFLTGFYSYHEVLYNSIVEGVSDTGITIDLYFHHCNIKTFRSVLQENLGAYGLYVITGFDHPQVETLLSRVPQKKLLQILRPPVLPECSYVSQDFCFGLKKSLEKLIYRLTRYEEFVLIFPTQVNHPQEIKDAFTGFCTENQVTYRVENKLSRNLVSHGRAFWVIEDSDLISLIRIGEEMGFHLGKEIGVISYNETPMKEIIRNGITVVSADFLKMGKTIARFIANPVSTTVVYHPEVIVRNSL